MPAGSKPGERRGGRQKGTQNKRTLGKLHQLEAKVAVKIEHNQPDPGLVTAEDLEPLDVMIGNMRHFHKMASDAEAILEGLTAEAFVGVELEPAEQFKVLMAQVRKAAGLRELAQACARDAAAYRHGKMPTVVVNVNKPPEMRDVTPKGANGYIAEGDPLRDSLLAAEVAGRG